MRPPSTKPEEQRARHRRIASDCGALVDLLNELYPTSSLPPLSASDKELGAWIGQRELVARLNTLREEAHKGTDGMRTVIGG